MKTTLLFTLLSVQLFAKSPAEEISKLSETCYKNAAIQASISLHFELHGSQTTEEETKVQKRIDIFNEYHSYFPVFKTACNEGLDGDEKFLCYTQGFSLETLNLVKEYDLRNVLSVKNYPECAYLYSLGNPFK